MFTVDRFGDRQLVLVRAGLTTISVATVHITGIIGIEGSRIQTGNRVAA